MSGTKRPASVDDPARQRAAEQDISRYDDAIRRIECEWAALGLCDQDFWILYRYATDRKAPEGLLEGDWSRIHRDVCQGLGMVLAECESPIGEALLLMYPKFGLLPALEQASLTGNVAECQARLAAYPLPQFVELLEMLNQFGIQLENQLCLSSSLRIASGKERMRLSFMALRRLYPDAGTPDCTADLDECPPPEHGSAGKSFAGLDDIRLPASQINALLRRGKLQRGYACVRAAVAEARPMLAPVLGAGGRHEPLTAQSLRGLEQLHSRGAHPSSFFQEVQGVALQPVPESLPVRTAATLEQDTPPGLSGWTVPLVQMALERRGFRMYIQRLMVRLWRNALLSNMFHTACLLAPGHAEPVVEVLYRLAAKCLLELEQQQLDSVLLPTQYSMPEPVMRAVELAMTEPSSPLAKYAHVTTLDFSEAITTVKRDLLGTQVYTHAPCLFRLVQAVYARPGKLVVLGGPRLHSNTAKAATATGGAAGASTATATTAASVQRPPAAGRVGPRTARWHTAVYRVFSAAMSRHCRVSIELRSARGVRSDDPLAPLLFSLCMRRIVEELQEQLGADHLVLAHHGVVVVLSLGDVAKPHTCGFSVLEAARKLRLPGLQLNAAQSKVNTRANVVHGDGLALLGTMIGCASARHQFLADRVSALQVLAHVLARAEEVDVQARWLMLRFCVHASLVHLVWQLRVDDVYERGRHAGPWRRVDNALLEAARALRAASCDGNLDWALASLPERMGGLGLLSYVECSAPARAAAKARADEALCSTGLLPRRTVPDAVPSVPPLSRALQGLGGGPDDGQDALMLNDPAQRLLQLSLPAVHARVRRLYEALPEEEALFLLENTAPLCWRWLTVLPSGPRLLMSDMEMRHSLQERLPSLHLEAETAQAEANLIPGSGSPTPTMDGLDFRITLAGGGHKCERCGMSGVTHAHADTCVLHDAMSRERSHNAVVAAAAEHFLHIPHTRVELEPALGLPDAANCPQRADLRVRGPVVGRGKRVDYDVSLVSLTGRATDRRAAGQLTPARSPGHGVSAGRSPPREELLYRALLEPLQKREKVKRDKYFKYHVVPVIMSARGALGPSAWEKWRKWRKWIPSFDQFLQQVSVEMVKERAKRYSF